MRKEEKTKGVSLCEEGLKPLSEEGRRVLKGIRKRRERKRTQYDGLGKKKGESRENCQSKRRKGKGGGVTKAFLACRETYKKKRGELCRTSITILYQRKGTQEYTK